MCLFVISFLIVKKSVPDRAKRIAIERRLIKFLCSVFVFSWTGVIRYQYGRLAWRCLCLSYWYRPVLIDLMCDGRACDGLIDSGVVSGTLPKHQPNMIYGMWFDVALPLGMVGC